MKTNRKKIVRKKIVPVYRNDTTCKLACGCEIVWYDGTTLAKGAYAWCTTHQDTHVKHIYARPDHYREL